MPAFDGIMPGVDAELRRNAELAQVPTPRTPADWAALQALLAGGGDPSPGPGPQPPAPQPSDSAPRTDFQPDATSPPPPPAAPEPQPDRGASDPQPLREGSHFDSSFTAAALDPSRGDPIAQFLSRSFDSGPGFGPSVAFDRGDAPEPFYAPASIFNAGPPPGPPPIVEIATASGIEDNTIALTISVSPSEGGDVVAVQLRGVPGGAVLSAGTNLGGGVWSIDVADLEGLTITPAANSAAPITLIVHAVETTPGGLIGVTDAVLPITIVAVADMPGLSTAAASGNEDSAIALPIVATLGDTDGSEVLTITVSGVPTGALLNHGTNLGGGVWTVNGAQLPGLAITPAANSDADFTLTVTATATDTGGDTATTGAQTIAVTVAAVADAPQITVAPASGNEDSAIPLSIAVALADSDGSETLGGTIVISGVPTGAVLSAGSDQGGGVWHLTQAQLAGLTITPLANSDVDFTLSVSATSTESSTGLSATGTANLAVTVNGVADTPTLTVADTSGNEDSPIALSITAAVTDPSESLAITIANVPFGATLSAGTNLGAGMWRLTAAQLAGLTITPPANSDADFTLTVTAISTDGSSTATQSDTIAVTVAAVADAPTLSVSPASGNEDSAIALSITSALTDPSESLAITISGVPIGATLNHGTDQGSGTWSLTAAQLAGLTITPVANSDADFTLTVTATSTDTGGLTATTSANLAVTVAPVADAPSLSVAAASGNEDSAIALTITAGLTDPSETLGITIAGVPTGAALSAGTNQGGGVWTLTAAQLAGLTITPPANSDVDFTLTVTATSTDGASTASTSQNLAVTVVAVADAPSLSAAPASGNEDSAIALTISAAPTDPSETLSISISGVPTGATLNYGTNQGGGVWALTAAQLSGLTLTPPTNSDADFTLTVDATSTDTGGVQATTSTTLAVTVAAVADAPTLSVSPASGNEDSAIALTISSALTDTDGSESLAITISGVPIGATLSAGTNQGSGVWSLTAAQLAGLTITPVANSDADFTLTVTATATDGASTASTSQNLAVTVAPVADAPSLTVAPASGNEDAPIALSIAAAVTDPSETLAITISGVPTGATLSAGTNQGGGVWALTAAQLAGLTITPPANSDADFTLTVAATSTDGGSTATTSDTIAVTVAAVADAPSLAVSPASGNEDSAIALSITAGLTDPSETLSISISGVPTGATLNHGTDQGSGVWSLTPAQLAGLTITPVANSDADFTLTVTATSTDTGGVQATTSSNLAVTVAAVADAPSLAVSPASGNEDAPIALSIASALTDPSETLSISIAGVPTGAALSAGTNQGGGVWTLTAAQLAGLTITPPGNSDGDFTLTVTATSSDGASTATTSDTIAVTVAAVADAPNLSASDASGAEDTAIALAIGASLADTDGSESLAIVISGVPAGAVLSAGTDQGDGAWLLTAAQLAGLTITPPLNDFSDFTLTVTATATDTGGDTATTSTTIDVIVVGAADAPSLTVANASGNEDGTIALSISAALTDPNETLSIAISGVPAGAALSAGTNQGGGVWGLTAAQLAGLTITPPANSDADFTLTVTATSTDPGSGDFATTQGAIAVSVAAVADTPSLSVTGTASGNEDGAIALTISGALADTDGSETLSFRVSGMPAGATLSAGTDTGGGVWALTAAQAAGVSVTPPANSDADFTLTVQAVASEGAGGSASSAGQTIAVTVAAVADAPTLAVHAVAGLHDTAIALDIGAGLVDTDGSESLALTISGVPTGAALSAGTDQGSGVWALTAAQLAGLTITPPAGDDSDFTLTVTATATDTGGLTATTSHALDVIVTADPLTLVTPAASGSEDSAIALNITTVVVDVTDTVTVDIAGVPLGATLSAGANQGGGVWHLTQAQLAGLTITPPANSDADFTLGVTATAAHQAGGNDIQSHNLAVTVAGVADAPSFSCADVEGNPNSAIALDITAGLGDTDGSESLTLRFTGVPTGATLSFGSDQGGNVWQIDNAQSLDLSTLTITPQAGSVIDFTLGVEAIVHDGASTTSESGSFAVSIAGGADRPNLSVADASGSEDSPIALDIDASLVDPSEQLSITIHGMPAGATLNQGSLQGNGDWLLSPVDLIGLTLTPAPNSGNDLALLIEATSTDTVLHDSTSAKAVLNVTVDPVADAPSLIVNDADGAPNSAIALDISSLLSDTDGSESLSLLIDGVPGGATLNHGTDQGGGHWALSPVDLAGLAVTPATNDTSDFTLTVHATATETSGASATTTQNLIVTVHDS
jgi:hypothetical protein